MKYITQATLSVILLLKSSMVFTSENSGTVYEDDDYLDDFYGSEEMVAIATGTKKKFHLLPSVATVITAKDIEETGALYLSDVLERVPGVHVIPSDIARLTPAYSTRGIQTGFNPQILVLMNGVEFKHPTTSGLTYGFRLPMHNIERIEIIRGPGSAVYGADAFSGVINIITKTNPDSSGSSLSVTSGSFSTTDLNAQFDLVFQGLKAHLSLSKYRTDGDRDRVIDSDLQSQFDETFSTSASLAPGYLPTQSEIDDVHFSMSYGNFGFDHWYWNLTDGGGGNGATQTLDYGGSENARSNLSKVYFDQSFENQFAVSANVSYYATTADSYLVLFPEGTILPIGDDGNFFTLNSPDIEGGGLVTFIDGAIGNPIPSLDEIRTSFVATYDGLSDHQFRLGIGWAESKLRAEEFKNFGPGVLDGDQFSSTVDGLLTDVSDTENVYVNDQRRIIRYISIQDDWQLTNDLSLTAGLRYDEYSDFGSTTNPRIALVWQTSRRLTAKALYGSAFRAPSFSELFFINNPSTLGNPNVKPEEIDTYELAFDYRFNPTAKLAINLFSYSAEDLIIRVRDPEPATTTTSQNAANRDGEGFEVEFDWKMNDAISIHSNFSYQNSRDAETKERVTDIPSKQLYGDARAKISENLLLTTQINYIMDRQRSPTDAREDLDDFSIVNFNVLYNPSDKWSLRLLMRNVFDKKYFEGSDGRIPGDIPMEGRSIFGSVKYTF